MPNVCTAPGECPQPAGECVTATCTAGTCGTANVPTGTTTAMQTPGDCLANKCNGNGAIVTTNDDSDVNNDSNPCTNDACSAGTATHLPVMAGLMCGVGQACDGAGSCNGCLTAATCPGQDDECKTRTCTTAACGFSYTAAGTATTAQTASDCQKNQCDGAGTIVPVADNTDVPGDSNQCTADVCTAGAPSHPPVASGAMCSQNGGTTCDGAGLCVGAAATCSDGIKNGAETGVDCGGGTCPACGIGSTCSTSADCTSTNCVGGVCFQSHLVINEVDYDQAASDTTEFVEIYNGTGAPVNLTGYSLALVNGATNTSYLTLSLAPAGTLPAGGYLVVASAAVVVPATAQKINFALATNNIQNGAPDGAALINTTSGTLVDALSYEGGMTSVMITGVTGMVSLVEGTVLPTATADGDVVVGSLSRLPNGKDLNNAATDWAFTTTATPGLPNL